MSRQSPTYTSVSGFSSRWVGSIPWLLMTGWMKKAYRLAEAMQGRQFTPHPRPSPSPPRGEQKIDLTNSRATVENGNGVWCDSPLTPAPLRNGRGGGRPRFHGCIWSFWRFAPHRRPLSPEGRGEVEQ